MARPQKLTDEQRALNKRLHAYKSNKLRPYSTLDLQSRLWYAAKARAKKRGLEFNLEKEDIILNEYCPILKIKLTHSSRRGSSRTNVATLDRIDPTKGYIKGNVEVISHLANTMKSNATPSELVVFATTILERYNDSNVGC